MQRFVMTGDYHTHTFYSDGTSSIEDNVIVAIEQGLKEIGITDHGFNHVSGGIKRTDIPKMREEINNLQQKYPQIKILLGLEANLLNYNGDVDLTEDDIKSLDYVILGIHKLTFGKGVKGSFRFNLRNFFWDTLKHRRKITQSYIKAMERYPIKVIVHPNYATGCDVAGLAKACAEKGVLIEFNGKRIYFDDQEMQTLIDSDAKFIIGSDAHRATNVGKCMLQYEFLKNYNFPLDRIVNIKYNE